MALLNSDGKWTVNGAPIPDIDERARLVRERWNRHQITFERRGGRLHRVCSCGSTESVAEGVYEPELSPRCPIEMQEAKEGR